jgi:hypothetical protein
MAEFLSVAALCFVLALLEVQSRERGFLAMRSEDVIPVVLDLTADDVLSVYHDTNLNSARTT